MLQLTKIYTNFKITSEFHVQELVDQIPKHKNKRSEASYANVSSKLRITLNHLKLMKANGNFNS